MAVNPVARSSKQDNYNKTRTKTQKFTAQLSIYYTKKRMYIYSCDGLVATAHGPHHHTHAYHPPVVYLKRDRTFQLFFFIEVNLLQ